MRKLILLTLLLSIGSFSLYADPVVETVEAYRNCEIALLTDPMVIDNSIDEFEKVFKSKGYIPTYRFLDVDAFPLTEEFLLTVIVTENGFRT